MKSLQLGIAFSLLAGCSELQSNSHTFFTPRQITTDPTFELALDDYYMFLSEESKNYQLYIKPFYQQSCHGSKKAGYFLPNNTCCASVREDGTGDINPLWFNVISAPGTTYNSTLCFAPQRTTYGSVFTFFANLCSWVDGLWLLANTAVVGAAHNVHVHETNRTATGTIPGFANLCDGFNNPDWCAGKIKCCGKKTKTGLDDIQIKIGYNFDCGDIDHAAFYGVLTIPTGNRPNADYLFEPLVGSKHASLGAGLNAGYILCDSNQGSLSVLTDLKYRYSLSAHERRSFDLCTNGDWSRYLLVVDETDPLYSLPGINYFTLPVNVTPRSTIDFWLALHSRRSCNWDIEIGYNLWWRQQEKVTLRCCNSALSSSIIGIYDIGGLCSGTATTASTATIAQSVANAVSDATFVPLTISDLNLSSAAHPAVLTNKIYLATSGHYDIAYHELLIGIGASYEAARHNSALDQWAVWTTFGFDF